VPSVFRNNTVSIGMGTNHMCAMNLNGIVQCWGDNNHNQLFIPQEIELENQNILVKLGYDHQCTIQSVYYLKCIGNNVNGLLDIPEGNLEGVRQLSSGFRSTCVTDFNYKVNCWG